MIEHYEEETGGGFVQYFTVPSYKAFRVITVECWDDMASWEQEQLSLYAEEHYLREQSSYGPEGHRMGK